jgi:hypothetical protein
MTPQKVESYTPVVSEYTAIMFCSVLNGSFLRLLCFYKIWIPSLLALAVGRPSSATDDEEEKKLVGGNKKQPTVPRLPDRQRG